MAKFLYTLMSLALWYVSQPMVAQRTYWPKLIARDSVPAQRVRPLQLVAVDTAQLVDFFIYRMRQRAQQILPGPPLRPLRVKDIASEAWPRYWRAWSLRVHDSINEVGAIGDAERTPAVITAAHTVEQGLMAYLHSGQAEAFDAIEMALYNGVASGLYGQATFEDATTAALWGLQAQHMLMATDGNSTLYINLYAATDGVFDVAGRKVSLFVDTSMPWAGLCKLHVQVLEGDPHLRLALRLPLWSRGMLPNKRFVVKTRDASARVTIKDMMQMDLREDGYIVLDRDWSEDTQVVVELAMPVQYCSHEVADYTKFVPQYLRRGPLTYAFWQPQGKHYFSDRTRLYWKFDLEHYDAFALITSLHSQPPRYVTDEVGDTACYLLPYYTLLKDHPFPLQIYTHEGGK